MDRVFLGPADGFLQDTLKLETGSEAGRGQAQAADELGEFGELERLRVGIARPRNSISCSVSRPRRPRWPPARNSSITWCSSSPGKMLSSGGSA